MNIVHFTEPTYGQSCVLLTRDGHDATAPAWLVMYCHGLGEDQDSIHVDPLKAPILNALQDAGYLVAASNMHGANWGNQASIEDTVALYAYVLARYNVAGVLLLCQSAGGPPGLLVAASGRIPGVAGCALIYGACSLASVFDGNAGSIAPSVRTAYGIASNGSDYASRTSDHDPLLVPSVSYDGLRFLFFASPDDTVIPEADHATPMAAHLAGHARSVEVITCMGEHGDESHFQPVPLLSFFRLCRSAAFTVPLDRVQSTLAVTHTSGVSTLTVASGEGSRFESSFPFLVTLVPSTSLDEMGRIKESDLTLVRDYSISDRSGDVLTIGSILHGASDRTFASGTYVSSFFDVLHLTELQEAVSVSRADLGALEVALTSKATDAGLIHRTGAETIEDLKTFSDGINIGGGPVRFTGNTTPSGFGGPEIGGHPAFGFFIATAGLAIYDVTGETKRIWMGVEGTVHVNSGKININSDGDPYYDLQFITRTASSPGVGLFGRPGQSQPIFRWGIAGVADYGGITRGGSLAISRNEAPADGEIAAGEAALWYDATPGAPAIKWRGKTSDGVPVTIAGGATGATGPGVPTGGTTGQVLTKSSGTDYATIWATPAGGGGGVTDHGLLNGLGDDDHLQYHTDARALTWLGGRSTADLPEGTRLYYTDTRADARIAAASLYRPGGTDVAVADGGTGASTAAGARSNLGIVIGTDVLSPTGNGASLTGMTTTQVSEGSNLYHTSVRVNSLIAASIGVTVAAQVHAHAASDITSGTMATVRLGSGTASGTTYLRGDNTWATPPGGSGTVTSVALSMPGVIFDTTVTGSPITGAGTLSPALKTQSANSVLIGPVTGVDAAPTFRLLVSLDIPSLDTSKITTGQMALARLGTGSTDATVFLRGDGTWAAVTAANVVSGVLAVARLGSGTADATVFLRGDGTWAGITAANVVSGVLAAVRLGTGTADATVFLRGNNTWSSVVAADIASGTIAVARLGTGATGTGVYLRGDGTWAAIAAGDVTSGIFGSARLGTGTADATTFLRGDNTWAVPAGGGGSGTVTSVALSMPGVIFDTSVTGSPVTSAGTLAPTLKTQATHAVLIGPTSGADATPTFRLLAAGDVPDLSANYPTRANNLSDLASAATARTNLGLGTAATQPSTAFAASGLRTLISFRPRAADFPAANYPTYDLRNNRLVLAFDAATEETCYLPGTIPSSYNGGGITASIHGMGATATSGDVKLGVSFERTQAGGSDLDVDDFAAEKTATATTDATSGKVFTVTIAFANSEIDGLLAGDPFRLRLARKAADAGDTMTGDWQLLALELREST